MFYFIFQRWQIISSEVKELIRHMMHIVPSKRPTAAQVSCGISN